MTVARNDGPPARRCSRRTVAKGAVWSVPVIASVALAPSAAASAPVVQPGVTVTGDCVTRFFSASVINAPVPASGGFIVVVPVDQGTVDRPGVIALPGFVVGPVVTSNPSAVAKNKYFPVSCSAGSMPVGRYDVVRVNPTSGNTFRFVSVPSLAALPREGYDANSLPAGGVTLTFSGTAACLATNL